MDNSKCVAIIKKGSQCSRNKKNGDYCGLHSKCALDSKGDLHIKTVENIGNNVALVKKPKVKKPKVKKPKVKKIVGKHNASNILKAYVRRFCVTLYNKLRGPAYLNRQLCNNTTDIYTFDNIVDIHPLNFYSYLDIDNFIYGFDLESIYKYIAVSNKTSIPNPYNNYNITVKELDNILKLHSYSKSQPGYMNIYNTLPDNPSFKLKSKIVDVFQKMDQLNNYTDTAWFYYLSYSKLLKFIDLVKDLYNYRMDLSTEKKKNILKNSMIFQNTTSCNKLTFINLQLFVVNEIDRLVSEGQTRDDRYLGSLIILTALTELVPACAESYSWLVQSTFN